MEKNRIFTVGLVGLAVIIFIYAGWVIATPPVSDDPHAFALIVLGIVMIAIGYWIGSREKSG